MTTEIQSMRNLYLTIQIKSARWMYVLQICYGHKSAFQFYTFFFKIVKLLKDNAFIMLSGIKLHIFRFHT